jgi:hypothetical protein
MANLTVTIDDDVLRRARIRAVQQDTSVNALLRDYLEAFAGAGDSRNQAADELLRLSARAHSGRGDRLWTRDELHERR